MRRTHFGVAALMMAVAATAIPAWAGYNWVGDGLGVVSSGTVPNGALYSMPPTAPWSNGSYVGVASGYTTQFSAPACDDIVDSRLVLGLYGGNADNTATVTVTVNGVATNLTIGGGKTTPPDPNPEFTTNQTNVYGSTSSGAWVVSIPVASSLNTNGNLNTVTITEASSTGFDGRIVYTSLWAVYQKASLNNSFQYAVAEGSGDIYTTKPSTAPASSSTSASRWVDFGGFATGNLESAQLDTLYTYEHSGQDNALFMNSNNASNGTLLADPAVSYDGVQPYDPYPASFDVTSDLSAVDNYVKFSVDPADGVTGSGTSVFRPQVAILDATSAAVPEPASLGLLVLGGLALLARRRRG